MNAPHKIDVTKGQSIGTVSQQWAGRPDDQKFLDLSSLRKQVDTWAKASVAEDIVAKSFEARGDSTGGLLISHPELEHELSPSNYGFGDVCSLVGAPSRYLAKLPAEIAAQALNHGFGLLDPEKAVQAYTGTGTAFGTGSDDILRCLTSPKYGRILDRDVVDEVMKLAGNGNGDTRWKVPGVIDWSQHEVQCERRYHQANHHALRQRPGHFPVPRR
jgi:hypothetical protein